MMSPSSKSLSHILEWIAIILILLLAAYLRMGQPGIVEFKRDEANLSLLALDLANGKHFPLLGIGSSVGLPNAPVNVYILAIPYLFTSDPGVATQFIGLLNVLAVGLTYLIGRRYGGPVAGIVAALFFAVNPWAVIFSRKIWAQNMLPPFVLLVLLSGMTGFVERRRWGQFWHLPLLVMAGQIHYGAFVILPMSVYLMWYGRAHWYWRKLAAGGLLAVLLLVPYTIGMIDAGLGNLNRIQEIIENNQGVQTGEGVASLEAVRGARLLLAGTEIHSLAGPEQFQNYLDQVPDAYPLFELVSYAVAISSVWLLYQVSRRNDQTKPYYIGLLLGLGFPIVIYTIKWTPFYIHYLIPISPIAFIILGITITKITTNQLFTLPLTIIITLILFLQITLFLKLQNFVNHNSTPNGFGTPLHYLQDIRKTALNKNNPIIGKINGLLISIDDQPTIWAALLYDAPSVRFENAFTTVYPPTDTTILSNECNTTETSFNLRKGEGCYSITNRPSQTLDLTEFHSFPEELQSTRFTNGAELLQWKWSQETQCIQIAWQIHNIPESNQQFAIHFLDNNGNQIASGDRLSWPASYWQQNDIILSTFCPNTTPEEPVSSINLGMYEFTTDGNLYNHDLITETNQLVGQSIRITLP